MTSEEFDTLLECYGADLSRWPEDRQSEAGRHLRNSAEARAAMGHIGELDRLIAAAAPAVSESRTETAIHTVAERSFSLPQSPAWIGWVWGPNGLTYAALFLLGGAGNLLTRLLSEDSPLESMFSGAIFSTFGG